MSEKQAPVVDAKKIPHYIGFWARVLATLVDTLLLSIVIVATMLIIYHPIFTNPSSGFSQLIIFFIEFILPIIVVIIFWLAREATPGKMLIKAIIVDADSLHKASVGQYIGRYFAYYVSTIVFCLGFLWIAFDRRKQGWHDKLANTVVIYKD
jgi:uncharacterized RDD family membrane protein YckC